MLQQGTINLNDDSWEQTQTRKCIYVLNTLDQAESKGFNQLVTNNNWEEATVFLQLIVEKIEPGTRAMRVYHLPREPTPEPYQDPAEILRQKKESNSRESRKRQYRR